MTQGHTYSSYIPISLKSHEYRAGFRTKRFMIKRSAMLFVVSGTVSAVLNGSTYRLDAGSSVILHPHSSFQLINDAGHTVRLQYLHYQSLKLTMTGDRIETSSVIQHALSHNDPIKRSSTVTLHTLFNQLEQAFKVNGERGQLERQLRLLELFLHLQAEQEMQRQSMDDTLQQTIAYMEANFAKPISLSDLPVLAGMTPSSYCRAFKKLTGMTPGHYLTRIRMLRAKELMVDGRSTLREISMCVGYQDELYFSRVFKKIEGMSPSAYVKRKERRIAVVSSYLLQDHLLALGIQPVAAPAYPKYYPTPSGFPSYLHDRLQGTVALAAERPLSSSDVMRHAPDTILKTVSFLNSDDRHWQSNRHTIFLHPSTKWEQYLREIAGLVDREPAAEQIIARVGALEQEARMKLAPITNRGRWAIIRLLPGDCRLYGIKEHALTELLYQRLHFQPDERIQHSYYQSQAFEDVLALNPEQILILWSESREIEQIYEDERWLALQAVKNNRVFIPDSREWDPWGPIGREFMLQSMLDYFLR